MTWELRSKTVKLDEHVGHTVTITGVRHRETKAEEAKEEKTEAKESKEAEAKEAGRSARHQSKDGQRFLQKVRRLLSSGSAPKWSLAIKCCTTSNLSGGPQ